MAVTRPFITLPGEHLINLKTHDVGDGETVEIPEPLHPVLATDRASVLRGIIGEDEQGNSPVVMASFASIPWPLLVPSQSEEGHRFGLPDLEPGALWHPMFWFGRDMAFPAFEVVEDEIGRDTINVLETADEWLYRIFLQIEHAGLYDAEKGEFVDVLATYLDLDIDDEEVYDRVADWLGGGEDPLLSSLGTTIQSLIDASNVAVDSAGASPFWAAIRADAEAETFALHCAAAQCDDLSTFAADSREQANDNGVTAPTDVDIATDLVLMSASVLQFKASDFVTPESGESIYLRQFFAGNLADIEIDEEGTPSLPPAQVPMAANIIDIYTNVLRLASQMLQRQIEADAAEAA